MKSSTSEVEGETRLGWLGKPVEPGVGRQNYQVSGLSTTREQGSPDDGLGASIISWRLAAEEAQFTLTDTWLLVNLFRETPQIPSAVKCLCCALSLYSVNSLVTYLPFQTMHSLWAGTPVP